MNNKLGKALITLGILVVGILLIPSKAQPKNISADSTIINIKQRETILPVITNTTNDVTIEVKSLNTTGASLIQMNEEFNDRSVNRVIGEIRDANSKGKKSIYLLLDSPGGEIDAGGRLIAAMGASKAPVYTVVTGLCASMCAMTEEYGKERYMLDRTTLMFHPASMGVMISGEVDKVISRLSYGKRVVDKMDVHTAKRSGIAYETFKARTEQELWDDAEDALRDHLIDAIVDIDFVKEAPLAPESDQGKSVKSVIRNGRWE